MIHHYAHLSGADCVGAVESALHKMAKDVLSESKCVYLPNRYDGRLGEQHRFDRVEVEFYDKDTRLRPDCIGYYEDKSLWIEFKRTHVSNFRPGDYTKFTIVIWIEGNDFDTTDDIIGGQFKVDMKINIIGDEAGDPIDFGDQS